MKKIFKIISLVMMMVMCFSVTAFAAETDETSNLKVSFTDEGMINTVDEDVTPGISVRAPAPAVSSVKVVAAQIKSDGYVHVTVQVAGYGKIFMRHMMDRNAMYLQQLLLESRL